MSRDRVSFGWIKSAALGKVSAANKATVSKTPAKPPKLPASSSAPKKGPTTAAPAPSPNRSGSPQVAPSKTPIEKPPSAVPKLLPPLPVAVPKQRSGTWTVQRSATCTASNSEGLGLFRGENRARLAETPAPAAPAAPDVLRLAGGVKVPFPDSKTSSKEMTEILDQIYGRIGWGDKVP
jgi:hypothetical protein